jgi:hypothetical protein
VVAKGHPVLHLKTGLVVVGVYTGLDISWETGDEEAAPGLRALRPGAVARSLAERAGPVGVTPSPSG